MAVQPGFAYSAVDFSGSSLPASNAGLDHALVDFSSASLYPIHIGQLRGDFGTMGQSGFVYRMRAFDTTLSAFVYWNAFDVDPTGSAYTGPGPLTGVVVSNILPF